MVYKVGDVLSDGFEVIAVDNTLKIYDEKGAVVKTGTEYTCKIVEGDKTRTKKFINWS